MIPPFDERGNLPPGVHWATWDELVERFGRGEQRSRLLRGFAAAIELHRAAGCDTVYVNGSFVTERRTPEDIDAIWDVLGVDYMRLDPIFFARGLQRRQQFDRFGCEFFSSDVAEASTGMPYVEYFQTTDDRRTKGIIALDLRRLP